MDKAFVILQLCEVVVTPVFDYKIGSTKAKLPQKSNKGGRTINLELYSLKSRTLRDLLSNGNKKPVKIYFTDFRSFVY